MGDVNEGLVLLWQEQSPKRGPEKHTLEGSEPQGEEDSRNPHDLPEV